MDCRDERQMTPLGVGGGTMRVGSGAVVFGEFGEEMVVEIKK